MVLVANKKTKSQMERDLALFLSDHTIAFVQWLSEVLDKLQTITLAKGMSAILTLGGGGVICACMCPICAHTKAYLPFTKLQQPR